MSPGPATALFFQSMAICAGTALAGCAATVYRPTEPRPAMGPGVIVEVVSVRGAAAEAEVAIHSRRPTLIGPVSWAPGDQESCSSPQPLAISRRFDPDLPTPLTNQFETSGDDVVFVALGASREIARSNLFLDFRVETSEAQGCLRVPLTAAGTETLWRATKAPWIFNFGVHIEEPVGLIEGPGGRLLLELRVLRPLGPVRPFFGFTLGGAACRGNCPPLESPTNDEEETSGTFFLFGAEAGLEHRIAIGRWSLGLTLGGGISGMHLGAHQDYVGDRNGWLAGPFASLSIFGPAASAVPGFSPAARRGSGGVELIVGRQTTFARGPSETTWLGGLGWRFEGTI